MDVIAPVPDTALLRQAYSRLAAGTSVVTLVDEEGTRIGLTVSAVTSVSLEPPLMLVCVNSLSRAIAPLADGAPFVINLLTEEQGPLGMRFASREPDKFAGVSYSIPRGGALYLDDTLASIECSTYQIVPAGDHHIVIGHVRDVRLGKDASPLVYFRSAFLR
jgi:3-hydroxy-9,10-secoandrosta-1,3,5(10)-triene-9,17-dione monooxygenase reductase component